MSMLVKCEEKYFMQYPLPLFKLNLACMVLTEDPEAAQ